MNNERTIELVKRIEADPEQLALQMIETDTYRKLGPIEQAALLGEVIFFGLLYASDAACERLVQAVLSHVSPEYEEMIAADLRERAHWIEKD